MKRLALIVLLLAAPAMAEDMPMETVTVNGRSLVGVWHGTLVQSGFYNLLGGLSGITPLSFGQMAQAFCRIGSANGELAMSCVQFGDNGRVTVENGLVRIGRRSMAFEGAQPDASHLRGHFRSRSWLGVGGENPLVAEGVRVTPQAGAPDKAGKAALLRRILEQGLDGVPHDAEAMKKNDASSDAPKLGAVRDIAYLGQEAKWDWPPPGVKADRMHIPNRPDFFSVYLVRFDGGERLCGLHSRDDGVLDAFRCA